MCLIFGRDELVTVDDSDPAVNYTGAWFVAGASGELHGWVNDHTLNQTKLK